MIKIFLYALAAVGVFLVVWFGLQKIIAPNAPVAGLAEIPRLGLFRGERIWLAIVPLAAGIATGVILYLRAKA